MLGVPPVTTRRTMTDDAAALLAAYDAQLRGRRRGAGLRELGPVRPAVAGLFTHGGFVSYESLEGVADVDALIAETVAYFAANPAMEEFEWKTRGHDWPPDLGERLEAHGPGAGGARDGDGGRGVGARGRRRAARRPDRTSRGPAARARRDRVRGGRHAARGVRRRSVRRGDARPAGPDRGRSSSSGSPRPTAGSSAPGGSTGSRAPSSPASGVARRCPSGAAAASTAR